MDVCYCDKCHLLGMDTETYLYSLVEIGSIIAEILIIWVGLGWWVVVVVVVVSHFFVKPNLLGYVRLSCG